MPEYPEKLTVSVTAEHIAAGVKGECEKCPIALAILSIGYAYVEVGSHTFTVDYDSDYTMPGEASGFIAKFDDGLSVEPFTFEATSYIKSLQEW